MKTDKPREFWITKNDGGEPTHIALFEKLNDRQQIHVIEYTAVEQLEQKVKEAESEADRWKKHFEARTGVHEYMVTELSKAEDEVVKLEQKLTTAEAKIKTLEWVAKDNSLRTHDGLTEKLDSLEAKLKIARDAAIALLEILADIDTSSNGYLKVAELGDRETELRKALKQLEDLDGK